MFTGDASEILMLIVVGGLSWGALTAQVAHRRGRNDFLWLALSLFLLGPFALLIVALLPKGERPARKVSLAALVAAALALLFLLLF